MKTVFSEIYEAMDARGTLLKREDFQEDEGRVYDLEDELENEMTEEMKAKFREFMELRGKKDREMDEIIFTRGVRLGMQMMLDAMLERERRKE